MAVKITIVGLGLIGGSAGLALGRHKDQLTRIGHDKDMSLGRQAQKIGAVDSSHINLPASVDEAGVVLIATPLSGIRETLEIIGQDLKEGAVVMDTAPVKEPVLKWAKDFIPAGRYYVGLNPALNPANLLDIGIGLEAARADLFENSMMGIIAPPGTPGEVVKLASDLSSLMGAAPFYLDEVENDSLMAAVQLLPQLMAAALLDATAGWPGWPEARKLAGRAYAGVSGALLSGGQVGNLSEAALENPTNTVRTLDAAIQALQGLREALAAGDKERFSKLVDGLVDARLTWWHEREKADWNAEPAPEMPDASHTFRRMIVGTWGERDKDKGKKK